ncbi:MAG: hypothetical protein JW867_07480 [Candidatus Omnitrophica bacterium]|nr:hypothetical protein [Candidatus Omnitrophota bacterium]
MKIFFVFLLFIVCSPAQSVFSSPSNTIELDAVEKKIRLKDLHLGDITIDGTFSFQFEKQGSSLVFAVEGQDITFNGNAVEWLKAKITKQGPVIFVDQLSIPGYSLTGNFDLESKKIAFNLEGSWQEDSEFLEGFIQVKSKIWGDINSCLASGYLTVEEGVCESQAFKKLRLDFLGSPPVLNITDSEIVLHDGSVFEYEHGKVLDIRDFSNPIIPNPEFVAHKVFFGDWQVFSENRTNAGLRKNVDERIDVFINTNKDLNENNADLDTGTELRYNWKDEQFLKLRMESDRTILGFERRKEF